MSKNITLVISMLSGNYVYQLMQTIPDWSQAHERTFFQAVVSVVLLVSFFLDKGEKK